MKDLTLALVRQWDHQSWNEDDLVTLPLADLQFLSRVLGIPHSGTKQKVIV